MRHPRAAHRFWLSALLLLAAVALAACSGDDPPPTASPTPTATATMTASPTSTARADSVRDIDFDDPAVLGPIVDHFSGGEIEPARIEYVDITGDGEDEAVVFVESGGTQGDLGVAVMQVTNGAVNVLGYVDAGGRVELRLPEAGGGVIVAQEGIYEPSDAACCPSKLRERTYRWDGDEFDLVSDQEIDNPDT